MIENDQASNVTTLSITPVDSGSPVPLYYQIENDLRRLISSGKIPPGATMPPELKLCRLYGVGRHTMRMALSRLAADNLITRQAGRGTLVKPQTDRVEFYLNRSFSRQMRNMGLEPHSKVLEATSGKISADAPEVFRNKLGAGSLHLMRLRFGGSQPIALQSTTIITELCSGLEQHDFNQESLYDVLARNYELIITEMQHTITATTADKFHADLLRVVEGDPLLVVKVSAFLGSRQIIEHTISHYRAEKYEYRTTHVYNP